MTPRSIRRAAERRARKLALKSTRTVANPELLESSEHSTQSSERQAHRTSDVPCAREGERAPISPAQLLANRANARLSTGPKTLDGKATSCLNAVKTALTGRTVLLPGEDAAEYERFIGAYEKELQPVGQLECDLVQSIADTMWRLRRIPGLEFAIYAKGRAEFANSFDDHDPSIRPSMIELQTFTTYEKQLRNLQLQEARLTRRREKETAELRRLQQERKAKEAEARDLAARQYVQARQAGEPYDPAANGFDFSIPQIENYLLRVHPIESLFGPALPSPPRLEILARPERLELPAC
jgi:hypothetical protein